MPRIIKDAKRFFRPDRALLAEWQERDPSYKFNANAQTFHVSAISSLSAKIKLFNELKKAYKNGLSYESARQNIQKAGAGLGEFHLKTIFNTNLRSAYNASRFRAQLAGSKPYLRYVSAGDTRVRDAHAAWHGLILPKDDPFWESNYPPNGFNCRCKVQALSQSEIDRYKYQIAKTAPKPINLGGENSFKTSPLDPANRLNQALVTKAEYLMRTIKDSPFKTNATKNYEIITQHLRQAATAMKDYKKAYIVIKDDFMAELAKFKASGLSASEYKEYVLEKIYPSAEKKFYKLGRLNGYDVLLEKHTFATHMHHPDITASEWALIPILLKGKMFTKNGKHFVTTFYAGKRFILALNKVDEDKAYYVRSFYAKRLFKDW